MKSSGVQLRASKLFSAFFSRKTLTFEITDKCENFSGEDVKQFVLMLQTEADVLRVDFSQHATQFTSIAISHLIETYDHNKMSSSCKFLAAIISQLSNNQEINGAEIQKVISNHSALLPPHLLVELDKSGVVSLLYYFQNSVGNKDKSSSWVQSLSKLACDNDNDQPVSPTSKCDDNGNEIFHQLFAAVVEVGFGTPYPEVKIESQVLKKSMLIINNVIRKIWDHVNAHSEKEVWMVMQIPNSSSLSPHFHLSSFQKCYLEQLAFLISYQPEIKASKAISCQHEWTFFKSPKNIVNFITQLLIPLEVEKVLEKIEEIVTRYEINWKTLLLVISATQICFPSGNRLVKALISTLLQQALDKSQTDLLLAALLLARQINAESTSGVHYGTWFSTVTSSSTTSKQFAFLMKFLTSIVRHEPLWVLIAHKGNHPHIPMVDNCRTLWTDYTVLIRTRIEDLKAKSPTDQITEEDGGLIKEVESAITSYEKSGRIPNSVVEAAIFSKPYFINKFLPALLKPRRVPIPSDIREDFINDLRHSGKLPLNMYETYVTSCKQSERETPMDCDLSEVSKDPTEFFNRIVRCKAPSQDSALFNKVARMLEGLVTPMNVKVFDLEKHCDAASLKIVDLWIEAFLIGLSENDQTDWENGYFLLLCPYPSLLGALYSRIRKFTSNCTGSEIEINGYGSIIFLLSRNANIILPIRHQGFTGDFVDYLCEAMDLTRSQSMLFLLRILDRVVSEAKSLGELDRVSKIAQLYRWVTRRASYSQKRDQLFKFISIESSLMEIKDWLRLEINVQSSEDLLQWHERTSYLQSILDTDYLNESSKLPRTILSALVQHAISIKKESLNLDCSQDLLQLLQSRMSEERPRGKPWLVQYWLELRQEHGSYIDQILWNLICSLPAYLLRSNGEGNSKSQLDDLLTLIEDYWRNTLMDGAWFPKHVTCHLLRALEGSSELVPSCLQFSKQIHGLHTEITPFGKWSTLSEALKIFHPMFCNTKLERGILWSGSFEVDSLVCQLMLLAAAIWFSRDWSLEWPWFVGELGTTITRNPEFLAGFKMSSWTSSGAILPWGSIIPNYLIRLLPNVLLHLLISWSDGLLKKDLPTAVNYLETLLSGHTSWIEITNAFVESLVTCGSRADYPAGAILDLSSLGKLNRDIQQILCRAPLRAIKTLQQNSNFQQLDPDFQTVIKQRII